MTALDQNPKQRNFMSPNNFKFLLRRAPGMEFFIQKCNIPSTSTQAIYQPGPFVARPLPGGPIDYQPLDITYKVAEDLENYFEVYNWMHGSTQTTNFEEYGRLKRVPRYSEKGVTSDIVMTILNSSKVAMFDVTYHDAFPVSVGQLSFESDSEGIEYMTCDCRFAYHYFQISRINLNADRVDPTDIIEQK
jgi:hypothetical protein